MAIQEHAQPDLAAVGDDLVHNLQAAQPLQIGVQVEINSVWRAARVEELIAKGEPQRVIAEALDLIEHGFVAPRPQSVRGEVRGLQAEPVDPRDAHLLIAGVENPIAARMPVPFSRRLRNRSSMSRNNPHQQSQRDRDDYCKSKLPQLVRFNTHGHTSSLKNVFDFGGWMT